MENYEDFKPQSQEQQQWVENYNNLSKYVSDKLKEFPENQRVDVLKELNPSDLSLMNLFLQSLKSEDYEICEIAKIVLEERGLKF